MLRPCPLGRPLPSLPSPIPLPICGACARCPDCPRSLLVPSAPRSRRRCRLDADLAKSLPVSCPDLWVAVHLVAFASFRWNSIHSAACIQIRPNSFHKTFITDDPNCSRNSFPPATPCGAGWAVRSMRLRLLRACCVPACASRRSLATRRAAALLAALLCCFVNLEFSCVVPL